MSNDIFGDKFMNTDGSDVGFADIAGELGIDDIEVESNKKENNNISDRIASAKKAIGVKDVKTQTPDEMIQSLLSDDNVR